MEWIAGYLAIGVVVALLVMLNHVREGGIVDVRSSMMWLAYLRIIILWLPMCLYLPYMYFSRWRS